MHYFRKLVALRKNSPALIYGAYQLFDADNAKIYAYTRTQGNETILVILNFSNDTVDYPLPKQLQSFMGAAVLLDNYAEINKDKQSNSLKLKPWQAAILKM